MTTSIITAINARAQISLSGLFVIQAYITVSRANYFATYGYDEQGNIIYPTTDVYEVYFNITLTKPIELVFSTSSTSLNQTVYWLKRDKW